MRIAVLYVGSSLLAPLKQAEREINRQYDLGLKIVAYNFGAPLTNDEWNEIEQNLQASDVVFAIHVMDGENAARLIQALKNYQERHAAVVVINCMPDLMRQTRMGRLDVARLVGASESQEIDGEGKTSVKALGLLMAAGSWVGRQVKRSKGQNGHSSGHGRYLKLIDRVPGILRFLPTAGGLRDVKNYLNIFCYFLQPTPANIRSMILYALKEYVPDQQLRNAGIKVPPPERMPSVAIYHPDATKMFETFADYENWYTRKGPKYKVQRPMSENKVPKTKGQRSESADKVLDPKSTIGLLLMRPQVVSQATKHYDALIHAIEAEGLSVIPALSTVMDNREAVSKFFVHDKQSKVERPTSNIIKGQPSKSKDQRSKTKSQTTDNGPLTTEPARVSQIVSLTAFSLPGRP